LGGHKQNWKSLSPNTPSGHGPATSECLEHDYASYSKFHEVAVPNVIKKLGH